MTSCHVVAALKGPGEAVLIEPRAARRRSYDTEWLEARLVASPGSERLVATPSQLLTAVLVMPRPDRPVSLIKSDHVLNAFE
jgi:hypothetical protein